METRAAPADGAAPPPPPPQAAGGMARALGHADPSTEHTQAQRCLARLHADEDNNEDNNDDK